jgi:hypothetical protein
MRDRQAHRTAPRRDLRLSGAAHRRAQRRTSTLGAPSPRAALLSTSASPGGQARLLGVGRTAMTASTSGLLANAATVTGRNGPRGGPGGGRVARVTGPARRGFAQVTGLPAPVQRLESGVVQAIPAGEHARSEHTYGGPAGPPLRYFAAVPAVRTVRIMPLTRWS